MNLADVTHQKTYDKLEHKRILRIKYNQRNSNCHYIPIRKTQVQILTRCDKDIISTHLLPAKMKNYIIPGRV